MKKELITFKDPKSPISEVFRTLRTNIQFMNTKKGMKSLLVTSTSPAAGKSWVAANLAVAFAQAGKKVILVDADMRKGRLFSIFEVSPTPGLSNFLSGINSNGQESDENILSYVKTTEVDNLYVIPAGNIPPNPSELLVSDLMVEVIEKLQNVCDLVIFDGTPSTMVADSIILSRYVDSTLIVAAYNETKIDELKKVKEDIKNVGGKIAGVIMNKIPVSQRRYEERYYYHGNNTTKIGIKSTTDAKNKREMEQLIIEQRKQANKEKARQMLKQNKEQKTYTKAPVQKQTSTIQLQKEKQEVKTNSIFNFETDVTNTDIKQRIEKENVDVQKLLKEMNDYVSKSKNELNKGE